MKERGGIGVAGLFLLLYMCENSLQRESENGQNIYSVRDIHSSGVRDTRLGQPSGMTVLGGGGPMWRERGTGPDPGPAGGRGDIAQRLIIDVSSGDKPAADHPRPAAGRARPPGTSDETVLGFETSGVRVPSDARGPGGQNPPGAGHQVAHGVAGAPQRGPAKQPASELGRGDISIEMATGPGAAHDSGGPSDPGQRTSPARPGQSRDGAAVSGSAGLPKRQRPAVSKQPGRLTATKPGARPGGSADPRDSINVSAEIEEGQPSEDGPSGPGRASAGGARAELGSFGPVQQQQQQQQRRQQHAAPPEWQPGLIPGQPGVDYPVLNSLPRPGFDCRSQEADGFYADTSDESRCQAFWVCHNDQKDGFVCPNGTIFNQLYLACDWWFNVRCRDSPQFYNLNRRIAVLGTRIDSQSASAPSPSPAGLPPSPSTAGLPPVLTLLDDILQYPRVPPVLPHSASESLDINPMVHSAIHPDLPSRNQYSDDTFHALDRWSVHVSGGVPGIPPAEAHSQPGRAASHEAVSTAVNVSNEQKRVTRRYVKRHAERKPKKHSKRSVKRRRGSRHSRAKKNRGMVQEAEATENAASALPAQSRQMEPSSIYQPRKRASDLSPDGAYMSVQEDAKPDRQPSAEPGRSEPLLQTVDKVAFPIDVKGPDFPKVEENFNIQETGGIRKSTSIKDVLPSRVDIPQSDAVKVMAASGSQQNSDANSGLQNPVGNQASITDLSDKQTASVPKNYAGISLTEDVQLDKDAHNQAAGAISDSERASGNYGQGHGASLTEDVEFDKTHGVPAANSGVVPRTNPGPQSTFGLEAVPGDHVQGPGASVQENVQIDQKRDTPQPGLNQQPLAMPQGSIPSAGGSNAGGNNGPGVSLTENVQIGHKNNDPPSSSNQGPHTSPQSLDSSAGGPATGHGSGPAMTAEAKIDLKNSGPSTSQNQAPGVENPMAGGGGEGPGLALTDSVQSSQKGNNPPDISNQASHTMPGDHNNLGGQTAAGDGGGGSGGAGPVDGSGPDNGGHPKGQMNVEAFLSDQRGGGAPAPTPPPSSAIRSEENVQVNFDQTPHDQHIGGASENPAQVPPNQSPGPPSQAPPEAASSDQQQSMDSSSGQDSGPGLSHDSANGIKISPKAEQVLEEQSNVKILIPYGGGGSAPSESTDLNDAASDFGLSNKANAGLALDNKEAHSLAQSQSQDQPLVQQPSQLQGQQQTPTQGQPPGQKQSQPRGQAQSQAQPQPQVPSRGQPLQSNTADLPGGNPPPATGSVGVSSGPVPPQPAPAMNDARLTEDVSVHRESSGGGGLLSGSPAAGSSRPGFLHAGDTRMNASAMTIPKKEGSSKILEQLDARSQFASNVGDEPGTVKTHVQMQEEKLGDTPGTSDLFDDPSALKREMPSENVKLAQQQQQAPPSEPQGEIIPGQRNVQITSESVSRIIKNPSRHRSAISDPSGLDLPELLRPPGFGVKYSPFKTYPTLRTLKPASPATPQPSVARLAGSIDMKPNNNAGGGSPNAQTVTAGLSEKQTAINNNGMGQPSRLQRTQRGDLSTKLSETLKMVDNILGPPPFKSKRNPRPELQRAAYLDTMKSGHLSSLKGHGQKRASEADLQDDKMGINLTVLINGQPDGQTSGQAGAVTGPSPSRPTMGQAPSHRSSGSAGPPTAQQQEKIRIFNSLKDMARARPKAGRHKKQKMKQTAKETEIEDVIEVKTSAEDGDSADRTYDYDISQLPAWMKKAVKSHVKSPH